MNESRPTGGAKAPKEPRRPATGLGHYLRDVVYGASDGIVTTLAVVSGTIGASFDQRVGIVLGIANLVADGLSMGASNYLGIKSDLEQRGLGVAKEKPWRHGTATFLAFMVAGTLPLLAFGASLDPRGTLALATALGGVALVVLGALRASLANGSAPRAIAETLGIGLLAAAAAWALGAIGGALV